MNILLNPEADVRRPYLVSQLWRRGSL